MSIEVRNVTKQYGTHVALRDVSLDVPAGNLVALVGPSGCGKTSLLRIIAGLETADAGSVFFHGEDTTDQHARDRRVGYVFQHYALFRNMTVFENVAFGLRVRDRRVRQPESEIRASVHELLELVQLGWMWDRYPSQLSGGQRQRVALARALAVKPKVLLLDEPFGALDAKVRKDLRRWLRRLHDELHVTSVFVTHDQEEALEVADRVVVMNEGRVEQHGKPDEVWEHPATPFVLSFLGNVNLFHGRLRDDAVTFVRSHEMDVSSTHDGNPTTIAAVVRHVRVHGHVVRLDLDEVAEGKTGQTIEVELPRARFEELGIHEGQNVFVSPKRVRVFSDGTLQ